MKRESHGSRMIQFQFFPRSVGLTQPIAEVVECFHTVAKDIASPDHNLSYNWGPQELEVEINAASQVSMS